MGHDDKALWNSKYAEAPEKWREPDPFLIRAHSTFLAATPPGLALDLAGGAGRHAIWLAEHGWKVNIIDVSNVGLELARENAARVLGPSRARELIRCQVKDLRTARDLDKDRYDLVLVFRYLNRRLFPALIRALKPGGTLIYSSYTIAQQRFAKGPQDARFLLQPDELRHAFAALAILDYRETVTDKATAELVARKPSSVVPNPRSG